MTTVPEVLSRFAAYYLKNPAWGSLHVVMDDLNIENSSVEFCRNWAIDNNDKEGEQLAEILQTMSKTQRLKLAHTIGRGGRQS